MSGKKDDTCGADSGIKDQLAPMRHLGGSGPAGYSSGPTHVDRADFGDTAADAPADPDAAVTAEVAAETPAEDDDADGDADGEADGSKPDA